MTGESQGKNEHTARGRRRTRRRPAAKEKCRYEKKRWAWGRTRAGSTKKEDTIRMGGWGRPAQPQKERAD